MYHILRNLGVSAVRIAAPLTHSLEYFANHNDDIQIRVTVNDAGGIERYWSGVKGGWFRPEDIDALEPYVSICEFDSESAKQEQALYRIYAERKSWPGSVNVIIHNFFKDNIVNPAIDREFFERRHNCAQRCLSGLPCHYCDIHIDFAERNHLKLLKKNLEEMEQNGTLTTEPDLETDN